MSAMPKTTPAWAWLEFVGLTTTTPKGPRKLVGGGVLGPRTGSVDVLPRGNNRTILQTHHMRSRLAMVPPRKVAVVAIAPRIARLKVLGQGALDRRCRHFGCGFGTKPLAVELKSEIKVTEDSATVALEEKCWQPRRGGLVRSDWLWRTISWKPLVIDVIGMERVWKNPGRLSEPQPALD